MLETWTPPSEGTIFSSSEFNAEPLFRFLEEREKAGHGRVSLTAAIIKALALGLREAPSLNCRLLGDRFLPHKTIDISCLVAVDGGKDLANAKLSSVDKMSLDDISKELKKKADKLRAHKDADYESTKQTLRILPVWIVRIVVYVVGFLSSSLGISIPALGVRAFPFGSALVTSVGMLGVEQAFVPFTPFTRVPLILMIGEAVRKPVVVEVEQGSSTEPLPEEKRWKIIVQRRVALTATLDHRYVDGTEAARMAKRLRQVVENPQLLESDSLPSLPTSPISPTPTSPISTPSATTNLPNNEGKKID